LARAVSDHINASSGRAIAVDFDVSSRSDCHRLVSTMLDTFGRIDGLVCGGMRRAYQPAEEFAEDAWDLVIGQGLTGYFRCAQASARAMLQQGSGAIVFITSIASHNAVDGGAAYCA